MKRIAITLACLAYVISPIDCAPELFLGPFGCADDLIILAATTREWFRKR